jgi:hypothetical protein
MRLHLVSDEPVLGNATVVTALIAGGVRFGGIDAWENLAEFDGPDEYGGQANFPVQGVISTLATGK